MTYKQQIMFYINASNVALSCAEICKKIIDANKTEGNKAHYLSGSISSILKKLITSGDIEYAKEKSVRGGSKYQIKKK